MAADQGPVRAESGTFELQAVRDLQSGHDAVLVRSGSNGYFRNESIGFNSKNESYVDFVSLTEDEQGALLESSSRSTSHGKARVFFESRGTKLVGEVGQVGELPCGLQLMHPVTTRTISSPYGWRANPTGAGNQVHIGQDYPIACGSPVYASEAGTVVVSGWAGHSGNRVTVDHGSNVQTGYSHNSKLLVKVGQQVQQGELIALAGTTGNSTGCHVHFEVIIDGRWHDPRNYLPVIPGQRQAMIDSSRLTVNAGTAPRGNGGQPPVRDGEDTSSNPDVVDPRDHRSDIKNAADKKPTVKKSSNSVSKKTPKVKPTVQEPDAKAKPTAERDKDNQTRSPAPTRTSKPTVTPRTVAPTSKSPDGEPKPSSNTSSTDVPSKSPSPQHTTHPAEPTSSVEPTESRQTPSQASAEPTEDASSMPPSSPPAVDKVTTADPTSKQADEYSSPTESSASNSAEDSYNGSTVDNFGNFVVPTSSTVSETVSPESWVTTTSAR
ncbi:peptidoglycan DD-metalloendopeptidase family protein [Glutamicibacter sp.]|uniref:M23 family metallopeptidase n=1 Tax=Glutamicibacter sp. TaxID=1931995 RepID=UPI0028BF5AA4|nr:peptidoglycan DD-metalloendopeptidase family protein [Glutamicibacter sp.]